jgi:chorismate-pyruvate lyase
MSTPLMSKGWPLARKRRMQPQLNRTARHDGQASGIAWHRRLALPCVTIMRIFAASALCMPLLLGATACAHDEAVRLQTQFEQGLAAQASATEALRSWCDLRGLATPARMTARLVRGADVPPPANIQQLLGVSAGDPLTYRHVQLMCGDRLLSQAHNWYVPSRLSAQMNQQLAQTDIPFGKVISSIGFSRHPVASTRGRDPACPAGTILANRAVLKNPDGRGLAMVVECYTTANLR